MRNYGRCKIDEYGSNLSGLSGKIVTVFTFEKDGDGHKHRVPMAVVHLDQCEVVEGDDELAIVDLNCCVKENGEQITL